MNWNLRFINDKVYSIDNDRFKEKKYVFSPFPPTNMHGFLDGDIRHIILADIMARYLRFSNHNVFFPTGVNSITNDSYVECKKLYKSLDASHNHPGFKIAETGTYFLAFSYIFNKLW